MGQTILWGGKYRSGHVCYVFTNVARTWATPIGLQSVPLLQSSSVLVTGLSILFKRDNGREESVSESYESGYSRVPGQTRNAY